MTNKLRNWKVIMIIQGILMGALFSFIPFAIFVKFGLTKIWFFLLIPIAMFFFTPLWAKVKKKKSNTFILQINSFFLFIFLSLLMTVNFFDNNLIIYFYPLLLFCTGMFVAGMVPFSMEIIRSYAREHQLKTNPSIYFIVGSVVTIIIPFLLQYFLTELTTKISLQGYFSLLALINFSLIFFNHDIQTEEITFKINPSSWKILQKNKQFWSYLYSSSFLYSINEVFGYILPILIFNNTAIMIIVIGSLYVIRKISYLFGYLLKINSNNIKHQIIWNTIITIIAIGLLLGLTIVFFPFQTQLSHILYLTIGLGGSQILIGCFLGHLSRIQKNNIISLVGTDHLTLGLMIEHVFGHAIFSLLLGVIIIPIIINFYTNILTYIIIYSIIIGMLLLSFNFIKLPVKK
ncbi:hypothetical protein M1771_04465 [Spiroplasma citri]|uniref:MFS transporter n=1 Tax=Spiroplasma citri TaxID=2133 RepID=A0AAX3T0W0_SPICI|nr:hypothetical protein [Spiroplasma citri]WFG97258.1 hypothetical protein M0C40_04470 [Spiroplasma citri]WFH01157.1 hypothetical protein M1771_04465 [Spiroplasma citri]